jgi:FkbM family methyltransferase
MIHDPDRVVRHQRTPRIDLPGRCEASGQGQGEEKNDRRDLAPDLPALSDRQEAAGRDTMASPAIEPKELQLVAPDAVLARHRSGREVVRALLWSVLQRIVMRPAGLRVVNLLHGRLGPAARRRFYYLCADESCAVTGPWWVAFAGRRLVLPLGRNFRLGWVFAIGFDGYDTELHELYAGLLRGPRPPRVFFDVGASYGLHSLRFLAHGVRTVSFEPNPDCHAFFRACCARNGFVPDIQAVAVGAHDGSVELTVPGDRTYLGTVVASVKAGWQDGRPLVTRTVPQVTLDAFVQRRGILPDIVKIDVEGSELQVLDGAEEVLRWGRPLLVLESWPAPGPRHALFDRLAGHAYRLQALAPASPPQPVLTRSAFLGSPAVNFLAHPAERP